MSQILLVVLVSTRFANSSIIETKNDCLDLQERIVNDMLKITDSLQKYVMTTCSDVGRHSCPESADELVKHTVVFHNRLTVYRTDVDDTYAIDLPVQTVIPRFTKIFGFLDMLKAIVNEFSLLHTALSDNLTYYVDQEWLDYCIDLNRIHAEYVENLKMNKINFQNALILGHM